MSQQSSFCSISLFHTQCIYIPAPLGFHYRVMLFMQAASLHMLQPLLCVLQPLLCVLQSLLCVLQPLLCVCINSRTMRDKEFS